MQIEGFAEAGGGDSAVFEIVQKHREEFEKLSTCGDDRLYLTESALGAEQQIFSDGKMGAFRQWPCLRR